MASDDKRHPLYGELVSIVGEEYVSDQEFVRRAYTRGPFSVMGGEARGRTPGVVARPATSEEVSEILKLANRTGTPVVPKGGGGSVSPFPPHHVGSEANILIDTTRMNKILDIDPEYMTVTTQCGVVLSNLAAEVSKRGFHIYTVDVPIHMDTVGGVLSGFCGGGEPSDMATAGVMNDYLLGLKVVLPTGEIIQTGGGPGTNIYQQRILHREAGTPDMTGMFVADGGAFGIKTEATFTIHPFPKSYVTGVYDMGTSYGAMWEAFNQMVKTEPYPYTRLLVLHRQGGSWQMVYTISGQSGEETEMKRRVVEQACVSNGGRPADPGPAMEIAQRFSARDFGRTVITRGTMMTYFGEAFIPRPQSKAYLDDLNNLIDSELKDLDIIERADFIVPYLRCMTISGCLLYFGRETPREKVREKLHSVMGIHHHPRILFEKHGGFTEFAQGEGAALNASVWSPSYKAFMKTVKRALDPSNILMPDLWQI